MSNRILKSESLEGFEFIGTDANPYMNIEVRFNGRIIENNLIPYNRDDQWNKVVQRHLSNLRTGK